MTASNVAAMNRSAYRTSTGRLVALGVVMTIVTSLPAGRAGEISGAISYPGSQPGKVLVRAAQTLPGNQALKLDGDGDYASTTITDLSGSELSIQYWFKGAIMQSIVRQQGGPGYLVAGWNGHHILSQDGGTDGVTAGAGAVDGNWHQLTVTWKQGAADGFASYLDGQIVERRASADLPIPNIDAQVYFGAFNGSGEFAQGQVDEIAIWRRALTETEVTTGWNRRLAGNETGLVGYWNFDGGTGADASPNGNHAELWGDAVIESAPIPGLDGGITEATLDTLGTYQLSGLPDGDGYSVTAFRDANTNRVQDVTEPFGTFAGNPFNLSGNKTGVDILLQEMPHIVTQPRGQRLGLGGAMTLSVSAEGTTPFTYEWRRDDVVLTDGGRISGAQTAALTVTGAQFTDAGVYTVTVRNTVGATDSNPAELQIIAGGATISGQIAYGGTQSGPVLVTAAQRRTGNQVLKLDGNGDFASTPLTDLSGSELTVQYWFRGSVSQSAVRQQSGGFIVSTWNGLHILSHDGSVNGVSAGANLTDGQWHHVAVTWMQGTPGGFASYLDGKPVTKRDSANSPIPNHNAQLYFGAFNGTGEFSNGEVDEISVWRRALSGSEIAATFRSTLSGSEEGLAGYWNFDAGQGTDLSPGGNHAELNGDAAIVNADIAAMGTVFTDTVGGPGAYTMPHIPQGEGFFVTAFLDVNGNGLPDAGEPTGAYAGNPFNLSADKTGVDLILLDPPVITTPPASLVVTPGATATLTVTVTGSEPLAFRWQRNGTDLADGGVVSGAQTRALTLTGVGPADEGNYRVVVSNPAAIVTSEGAALIIASGITDRLVGHWKFDETAGSTAVNTAAGGDLAADGELQGYTDDSQWGPGQIGGSLAFGGPAASQWVLVNDYPKPDTVMSISAWVWADARPTWASIAKNWGQSASGQFHFGLNDAGGDLSNYITQGGGGTASARTGNVLPTGAWIHTTFVCDGARLRLYQNGIEVASAPYDGTLVAPPVMASLAIGVKTGDDGLTPAFGYWQGRMDDVGLWRRALTPAEVNGIYVAGLAGKDLTQSSATPTSVTLTISRSGTDVTISWSASATGFTLQETAALVSGTWQVVPGVTGTSITVPTAGQAKFYRLVK